MTGGGGDVPLPPAENGGEFLLSLLQNRQQHHHRPPPPPLLSPQQFSHSVPQPQHQQQQQQQQQLQQPPPLTVDPAVAAVGPAIPYVSPWGNNGHDHPPSHLYQWQQALSAPFQHSFFGFPQNHFPPTPVPGPQFTGNPIQVGSHAVYGDDQRKLGFQGFESGGGRVDGIGLVQHQKPPEHKLKFGSFSGDVLTLDMLSNGNSVANEKVTPKDAEVGLGSRSYNGFERAGEFEQQSDSKLHIDAIIGHVSHGHHEQGGRIGWVKHSTNGKYRSTTPSETMQPPPGFPSKAKGRGNWDSGSRGKGFDHNVDPENHNPGERSGRNAKFTHERERVRTLSAGGTIVQGSSRMRLKEQLDHPGPPTGSKLHSVSASKFEESASKLHRGPAKDDDTNEFDNVQMMNGSNDDVGGGEIDDLGELLVDSLLHEDECEEKDNSKQHRSSRDKDFRSDPRGKHMLTQRMRSYRRHTFYRVDIDRFNAPLLALYESLIPAEDEKAKQNQLLTLLQNLVIKEWPQAKLYLYGSCANSFGVSNSDVDVCLAIKETDMEKSEILLKLADILQSDNLQNVQALTRARVPIVKLMDPATGLSCDICINNVLAVVNTKLLRDYAQIDSRLRQLAFIVKHWAKSRGVNETYQGTLSSYAYVLMCIHFLQQRRPAILPCLQAMETTYCNTVDDVECAFFDQVEQLRDFGMHNKETIAQLVWGFFNYWAYCHDYANDVISVRRGSTISKLEKDWTRRIGNDRHLICIEDPFEISHDLGRVVDKHSIRVLREEFERAAEILQYDPNPCIKLFEPYIPS